MSQMRAVLSPAPVTSRVPVGEKTEQRMGEECPAYMRVSSVLSRDGVAYTHLSRYSCID